jgi:hypothetical protein
MTAWDHAARERSEMADTYQQHGHAALKRALQRLSEPDWLDKLGPVGVALREWRSEMIEALGGESAISPQQRALIELATRTHLLIESIDRFVFSMPSPVNRRQRKLYAVVEQRQRLVDSMARLLGQLGLARLPKPTPSLRELLQASAGEGQE